MSVLHEYLARSARDHGQHPALGIGEKSLTYDELDAATAAAAAGLARHGIGRGSRVAVWLPKRVETYVGLLASAALGAAYVPVDVAAPPQRAGWILDDGRCDALLCRGSDFRHLPRPLPAGLRLVVLVDGDARPEPPAGAVVTWSELTAPAPRPAAAPAEPDALAYILYTSGSTGTPKGVAVSQRAAAAFVAWAGDLVELAPGDRVSNHAALSFDLSIFDVFAALRAGAALLPVPNFLLGRGYPFARFIQDRRISVWYSVPTVLSRIADSQARRAVDLSSLRTVIFAGEPFPKAALIDFQRHVHTARLFNFYGPTETNVCLYHEVGPADLEDDSPVPIGRPCPYSDVLVRGDGELLVAGESLMAGYWRAGRLEREIFQSHRGRLYYPTGDYVSVDSRGRYLFNGRRDSQIKLHGYRIELGEIEEALAALPGVAEAAVACHDEKLIAFVVSHDPPEPVPEGELRDRLAHSLPAYMMPDDFHWLPSLPRTDRGKVDRHHLLATAR